MIKLERRTEWKCPETNDVRVLTMPNLPRPCHGPFLQPRTIYGRVAWDKTRKRCYVKAGYKCEACGADVSASGAPNCHELFDIDYEAGTSTFVRCICLCKNCVDEDTEVLTSCGWKKIPLVTTEDEVACWDKKTGGIEFQHPSDTVTSFCEEAVKIEGHGATLFFSEGHRIPLKIASKQSPTYGEVKDVLAKDYKASHYYNWLIGGENCKEEHLSPEERVFIAVEADGSIAYDKEHPRPGQKRQRAVSSRYGHEEYRYTYVVELKKERKVERLKTLLSQTTLPYEIGTDDREGYTVFKLWSNLDLKHFAECFQVDMGKDKALEFLEELVFWDGSFTQGKTNWYTNKPEEIDFVQAVAAQCNVRTNVYIINRIGNLRKGQWKTPYERLSYIVSFTSVRQELCGREMKESRVKWGKNMYCLVVPTSYFVVRKDGLVFVTGNCHQLTIHNGRALTLFKQGNPLYRAEVLLKAAESSFKVVHNWNVAHPGETPLKMYATFTEYLKEPELAAGIQDLIAKYHIKFWVEDKRKFADWGKWKVVVDGKDYPTPYASYDDWATAMQKESLNDPERQVSNPFSGGVYDEVKELLKGEK